MLFIFTALYPEAKALIRALQLKKVDGAEGYTAGRFLQFRSRQASNRFFPEGTGETSGASEAKLSGKALPEKASLLFETDRETEGERAQDILLTVTGTGMTTAAAAVAAVLAELGAGQEDMVLSFGCAAVLRGEKILPGALFRIAGVWNRPEQRWHYPDLLLSSDLPLALAVTDGRIIDKRKRREMLPEGFEDGEGAALLRSENHVPILYDMETAAVVRSVLSFLGPHQISCLRMVSDSGVETEREISADRLSQWVEKITPELLSFVDKLGRLSERIEGNERKGQLFKDPLVEKAAEDARFSKTMQDTFQQYLLYLSMTGFDWRGYLNDWYRSGILPARDKRQGKKLLQELRVVLYR